MKQTAIKCLECNKQFFMHYNPQALAEKKSLAFNCNGCGYQIKISTAIPKKDQKMEKIKTSEICDHCKQTNTLSVAAAFAGKKLVVKCAFCSEKIAVEIPNPEVEIQENEEGGTVVRKELPRQKMVILIKKSDYNSEQQFEITQAHMTIGRLCNDKNSYRPDIAIVTTDLRMSRKHALLKNINQKISLMDHGSQNGTKLNDLSVAPREEIVLSDGDRILLGRTTIEVKLIANNN